MPPEMVHARRLLHGELWEVTREGAGGRESGSGVRSQVNAVPPLRNVMQLCAVSAPGGGRA